VIIVNERVIDEMKDKLNHWNSKIQLVFVLQQLPEDLQKKIDPSRTKPWGTAQAVLCAEPFVSGLFVVMNADDYYGKSIMLQAMNFFQNEQENIGLIAFPIQSTLSENGGVSRGICEVSSTNVLMHIQECHEITKNGQLYHSKERFQLNDSMLVSMNFWLFPKSIFVHLSEYVNAFLQENYADLSAECYLPNAIQHGISTFGWKVTVLEAKERWAGLTFPEDKEWVEASLLEWTHSEIYPLSFAL
jgi:NDP-sugar pyrophosphorylase family protein